MKGYKTQTQTKTHTGRDDDTNTRTWMLMHTGARTLLSFAESEEMERDSYLDGSYSCSCCWIIYVIYAIVMSGCLWKKFILDWVGILSKHRKPDSICVCVYMLARVANTLDTVAVLCWHWGWASGNHPGDITLATVLSLGETVEAHPCRCGMTGCPLRTGSLERWSVRVCLCISVDFTLATISLSNPHGNTLNYSHTYTYE